MSNPETGMERFYKEIEKNQLDRRDHELLAWVGIVAKGLLFGVELITLGILYKNHGSVIVGAVSAITGPVLSVRHFIEAHRLKLKKPTVWLFGVGVG